MGYSLRTDRYRYIEWRDYRDKKSKPIFVELYDHKSDPDETSNVAKKNARVVDRLSKKLQGLIK